MKNKNEIKIIITVIIIVISIFISIRSFPNSSNSIYQYTTFQNTDYKVYLTPNEFYTQDYLEKDNLYLKDLTKYIEFNFLYNYNASMKENINCKYDILSTLYIEYSNTGQVVLEKEHPIIENKTIQQQYSNKIDINEKINIDYQKYNGEVEKFKEQFNLPITAYLVINFNVQAGIENQEKISTSKVTIYLNQPAYEIKVKDSDEEQNTILETEGVNKNTNFILLNTGILLFSISLGYLLYQIWKIQLKENQKIQVKVSKILKKYREIIVELEYKPNFEMKNVVDVKEFDELIDVEEEIRNPILFFEDEGQFVFLIMDDNVVYRKIL